MTRISMRSEHENKSARASRATSARTSEDGRGQIMGMSVGTNGAVKTGAACLKHLATQLPANPDQLLIRASEVEQNHAPNSALAITLSWIRQFLAQPHPELGRAGPVCPFAPIALNQDSILMTEMQDADPDPQRIIELISHYRDLFAQIEPRSGPAATNKCIVTVFSKLSTESAGLVDAIQAQLKGSFVEAGLMLGEFHEGNHTPGLRNPDFNPLRSPIPMLVIRQMVESDLPFLRRELDAPIVRASYLRSYLHQLRGNLRVNYFNQAINALIAAEIELHQIATLIQL